MSKLNRFKNQVKSNGFVKKIAAGSSVALASASSFAVDHSTAIGAAGTDGTTNTTAAVVVVLGIAAVVTGVGIVLKLLGR